MKTFIFVLLALVSNVSLASASTQKLSCEDGNIQIEFKRSFLGSTKYRYQDKKRDATASFENGSITFGGTDEGDFVSAEMFPSCATSEYTAVIEDFDNVMDMKVGADAIPMLLTVQTNEQEEQVTVWCDVVE